MKIKNITIENWRSIKNLNINTKAITTFVGKNNNGKSNILSAILFFFGEIPKVNELDFNDRTKEIFIEVCFHELDDKDKQQFKKYVSPIGELSVKKTANTQFEVEYKGYIEVPCLEHLREENISKYLAREKATIFPFHDSLPATGKLLKDVVRQHLNDYIEANKATIAFERRLENTHFMGNKNIAQGMLGEVLHIPPISSAPDELHAKGNTAFNKLSTRW
ncbi:MAG: DUF2813 domain-containing protein [Hymenobacter sp.]|nr:MAG: DUF2813 domain-containing protein [Hymenobacter sp.]